MARRQLDEEEIFHVARGIPNSETRSRYLEQVCSGDQALRERVEALLAVHEREEQFLKSIPDDLPPTLDHSPLTERPGSAIGRYRLMEQVGEGGMGMVFVAEQERPVRRKVALKIIKPGMDTKEVIARFEAERQALALMDHPNIAKVLDAGSTESGRPYFVMDLVRGIPITEYCDQAKLAIRERLELFIQVCKAIQHAHQKGIIHRDVKPSNVLVTLHDGKPVPKVIDFGVAKATNQRLTERTIYTRLAQIIGTPMYMSPEQAELSGLDVDTRSDVYSLGVLLYELLTGTTPFDKQRFERAAYDEIRRIVREEEPPKPSTKISTLGQSVTSVSSHRNTDPNGLSKAIRGDLDVIVMKSIEKDRSRRYDSASGLATDVQRCLNDEPIVARPPSLGYRVNKFVRRNRVAVTASALVFVSAVLGVFATGWSAYRASQTLKELAETSYEKAVSDALFSDEQSARVALDLAERTGVSKSRGLVIRALLALNRGEYDEAVALAESAMKDRSFSQNTAGMGASAVLAIGCLWAGYDDRWGGELEKLRQLQPQSDTDHLLKAYVLALFEPAKAMSILNDVPRVKHSPVGLVIHGWYCTRLGMDERSAELLHTAAQDFKYAQYLLRSAQGPIGWRIWALVNAIELAKQEGRSDDVRTYIEEGRPLAEQLATFGNYASGDFGRWLFYRAAGEEEEASRAIRKVGQHPGTYSWFLAADCLRREGSAAVSEFDKAVAERHRHSKYVGLARAHLLTNTPGESQKARRITANLVRDESRFIQRHALAVHCLIANPEEVKTLARQTLANASVTGDASDIWTSAAFLEYLSGDLDESELLERTAENRDAQAAAHFTIAMKQLGEGHRDEAKEHFSMAVNTNTIGGFDYEWSKAYLARMASESEPFDEKEQD